MKRMPEECQEQVSGVAVTRRRPPVLAVTHGARLTSGVGTDCVADWQLLEQPHGDTLTHWAYSSETRALYSDQNVGL